MEDTKLRSEPTVVSFKIPWDSNAFKGFCVAVAIMVLLVLLSPLYISTKTDVYNLQGPPPAIILNFGLGDGTGKSAGNLHEEGAAHKGPERQSVLEDAKKKAETVKSKKVVDNPEELSEKIIPVKKLASNSKDSAIAKADDNRNQGVMDGTMVGGGLGTKGSGAGKGYGFGDIEWAGGGNRIVLKNPLPKFPNGVNYSAEIKLRFTVNRDGTVGQIIPLQKADPRLEQAALDALRQWRFNPIKDDIVMVGTIPLTFVLR